MLTDQDYVIAIVEDDPTLREEISLFLRNENFIVHEMNNGISLTDFLVEQHVNLLILDVNLPGQNGFDIANYVRQHIPQIGIVMLTARTSTLDRLRCYEAGADIFMPKPTPPEELLAAIKSLQRRLYVKKTSHTKNWQLDIHQLLLYSPHLKDWIHLTPPECALLHALIKAPNHTLDSDAICNLINIRNQEPLTKRALENLASRLRKKISDGLPKKTELSIRPVWGVGYQLMIDITIQPTSL